MKPEKNSIEKYQQGGPFTFATMNNELIVHHLSSSRSFTLVENSNELKTFTICKEPHTLDEIYELTEIHEDALINVINWLLEIKLLKVAY